MGPPTYKVEGDVSLIAPNELPVISRKWGSYTVVGAGKTGIDACLWLLALVLEPNSISWIMTRDSWCMERGRLQPESASERKKGPSMEEDFAPFVVATSPEDVFWRQEQVATLTRLNENVWPTIFRCATISYAELEQIRKIKNIIRKGGIIRLGSSEVVLEEGTLKPTQDTLYIHCTADGLAKLPPAPVFQGKQITLQSVRYCQQVFSAAFIGHIEAAYDDENFKNQTCPVVPHPDDTMDYLSVSRKTFLNEMQWAAQPATRTWLAEARLNWIGKLFEKSPEDTASNEEHLAKMGAGLMGVCSKLEQLMAMNNQSVLPAMKAERL